MYLYDYYNELTLYNYSFIKFSQVINAEWNIFIGVAICLSRFQKYDRYKITILDITSHC